MQATEVIEKLREALCDIQAYSVAGNAPSDIFMVADKALAATAAPVLAAVGEKPQQGERNAASPAAPAGQHDAERAAFITAYRLWCYDSHPDSHPEMVLSMAESHWGRAAGAMWLARANVASQAAPAKAEGWQLVPVKPTPEMLHALYVTPDFVGSTIIRHSVDKLPDAYRAMLAAAPSTPAKEPT